MLRILFEMIHVRTSPDFHSWCHGRYAIDLQHFTDRPQFEQFKRNIRWQPPVLDGEEPGSPTSGTELIQWDWPQDMEEEADTANDDDDAATRPLEQDWLLDSELRIELEQQLSDDEELLAQLGSGDNGGPLWDEQADRTMQEYIDELEAERAPKRRKGNDASSELLLDPLLREPED